MDFTETIVSVMLGVLFHYHFCKLAPFFFEELVLSLDHGWWLRLGLSVTVLFKTQGHFRPSSCFLRCQIQPVLSLLEKF